MHPPPDIKTLDEFTLSVKAAEGSLLPYLGYVEVNITATFQSDNMMVILLVGTLTRESLTEDLMGLNMLVPITTGTDLF
jgi:hypothetical protein